MKPFELLSQTASPDGTILKLIRRGTEFLILADGAVLMSSRTHGSEESLAAIACERLRTLKKPSVLIGGLGLGFTLRATLDLLSTHASVLVAELVPAVVEWNRGPLATLAGHPLNDPRVRVEIRDVAHALRSCPDQFDAILLDVDNGPAAFTTSNNAALYDHRGIAAAHTALNNDGVLAIWAAQEDEKFQQRLHHAGFSVQMHRVRAPEKGWFPPHHLSGSQIIIPRVLTEALPSK